MNFDWRPYWRHELAVEYAGEVCFDISLVQFDKKEDETVKELTKYLCREKVEKSNRKLRKEFPYIHEAYKAYTAKNSFSDVWILEALLLTDLKDEEIAKHIFANDPKFVKTFCLCFFDVRDKERKGLYIKNVRALCEDPGNIATHDYIWKYRAVIYGADFFIKTVLRRDRMSVGEMEEIAEDHRKLLMLNGWDSSQKRHMLGDEHRTEEELMEEKQNVDLYMADSKNQADPNNMGDAGKELITVLHLVNDQIELVQAGGKVSAEEPRLTKKEK